MTSAIPVIDLEMWRSGDLASRSELARQVDVALQSVGFLLVENHGIPAPLAQSVRDHAAEFFALPAESKEPYRTKVGGRGWIPLGAESNSYAAGVAAPADLKESFKVGTANPAPADQPNVWVDELPSLEASIVAYLRASWRVAAHLFELFALALGLPINALMGHASQDASSLNVNHYPPLDALGRPEAGQFRIGAHSDFGVLTVLDRQPGYGGLQIQGPDGDWTDAPWVPGTLTINIGDLLARWTGDRWRSTFHRVLPPSATAPDEALISLVHFCGVAATTVIETLPVNGPRHYDPVLAGDYLRAKLNSIDVA